jgi:LysM repeat protein
MRWFGKILIGLSLAAGLLAARPAAGRALADGIIHIVQPGENLFRIGLAYGIGWQAIMEANGLASTNIYVGESLIIPVAGSGATTPPAPPPDPTPQPTEAAPDPAPTVGNSTYLIQRGDTLWLIAQRFGVSVGQMLAANNISNPNYIYYGQVLVIPGPNAPADAPASKLLSVAGQGQALALDCESRSAVDWAGYFGVSIGELDFLGGLPASDDPDAGFVGSASGALGQVPPGDYGVHAGPVAALLRAYGLSARAASGLSWEAIQAEIDAGRPVITWVISQVGSGTPLAYTAASDGHTSTVAAFEHTVMVIGYAGDTVTILDGGIAYTRSRAQFLASWGVLGNMAVLWSAT